MNTRQQLYTKCSYGPVLPRVEKKEKKRIKLRIFSVKKDRKVLQKQAIST